MFHLRHGLDRTPGQITGKVRVANPDGSRDWDGRSYWHQSSPGLVLSLCSHMKSQAVWDKERAWTELTNESNVGGRWLREQDDPRATFEQMWRDAYDNGPKLSFEQLITVLVSIVGKEPGIQMVYLREAAAAHGWGDRGRLDRLLAAMVEHGVFTEKRTTGPGGVRVTSRRFWKRTSEPAARVAKSLTVTLSLGLLAVTSVHPATGRKDPVFSRSYYRLLTDKNLRRRGLQLLRARLTRLRYAGQRRTAPPRPSGVPAPSASRMPTAEELEQLRAEIDCMELDVGLAPIPMGSAGMSLRCVL